MAENGTNTREREALWDPTKYAAFTASGAAPTTMIQGQGARTTYHGLEVFFLRVSSGRLPQTPTDEGLLAEGYAQFADADREIAEGMLPAGSETLATNN
jgi:hypothetical protein